jgi:hypothetical protein
MSDMVERVAKAIMAAENPDSADQYSEMARAAIEAMREPTKDMAIMGHSELIEGGDIHSVWDAMIDEAIQEQVSPTHGPVEFVPHD